MAQADFTGAAGAKCVEDNSPLYHGFEIVLRQDPMGLAVAKDMMRMSAFVNLQEAQADMAFTGILATPVLTEKGLNVRCPLTVRGDQLRIVARQHYSALPQRFNACELHIFDNGRKTVLKHDDLARVTPKTTPPALEV